MNRTDISILRDLAQKYIEMCNSEQHCEKRDTWRKHNALQQTRPLILAMNRVHFDGTPESVCLCQEEPFRAHEYWLRFCLYHAAVNDDTVFPGWNSVRASLILPGEGWAPWGVPFKTESLGSGLGWKIDHPLKSLEDSQKMIQPHHRIDEQQTALNFNRLNDAIGDIVPIVMDRGPLFGAFPGDLSTDMGYLRGPEQMMYDMMDNPEWFHKTMAFMRDGVLQNHSECEAAGHLRTFNSTNQSVPYATDLPDPSADDTPVTRKQLWLFFAAQEFASTSPEMHDEFLLQYQIPIMEKYGLVAYGCCEDLTHKIDILRKIPNLRRIAVTPWADVPSCAEQIGTDYVCSWRPNPAAMVSNTFDPERVRKITREALTAFKHNHCIVDITLKDVHNIGNEPHRIKEWVRISKECARDYL